MALQVSFYTFLQTHMRSSGQAYCVLVLHMLLVPAQDLRLTTEENSCGQQEGFISLNHYNTVYVKNAVSIPH